MSPTSVSYTHLVADAAERGDAEHPGHLQQLRISGPDAAQQIGIEDRQDDQEGDQHRQIPGGKQDQRQNDKGGHRNGLDGQEGWRQQLLHPAEPGGQSRQHNSGRCSKQETRCDAHQGIPDGAPKIQRGDQFRQPRQHTEGRDQDDALIDGHGAVSYTHLDVYKRQYIFRAVRTPS